MGTVYRVHDRLREVEVALKVMLPEYYEDEGASARFRREVEIALSISHENVVRVFDMGHDAPRNLRFFTMEVIDGISLRGWLDLKIKLRKLPSVKQAVEVVSGVLEALVKAHAVTIHCDLKPENVMLPKAGGVKILDFGVAKDRRAGSRRGFTSNVLGTALYMPPEQLRGSRDLDGRTDIYAVFAILYEMLIGEAPVGRWKPLGERRPGIPKPLDDLITSALDADRDNRPASAREALDALRASLTLVERSERRARPLLWIAGAVGALIAFAGLGFLFAGRDAEMLPARTSGPVSPTRSGRAAPEPSRPKATTQTPAAPTPAAIVAAARPATSPTPTSAPATTSTPATASGSATGTAPTSATQVTATQPPAPLLPVAAPPSAGTASPPAPPPPDVTAPTLVITSPRTGWVTRAGVARLEGAAFDDRAKVFVLFEGTSVTLSAGGAFALDAPLEEGENVLALVARDAAGNERRSTVRVTRDATPPLLVFDSPREGAITTATSVVVTGHAEDASGAASVTCGEHALRMGRDGSFSFSWPLGPGANAVTFVARDAAGNERTSALRVVRDTEPPVLEVSSPASGLVTTASAVAVTGQVRDDLPAPGLTIAGRAASLDTEGRYDERVELVEGTNRVLVRASDAAGRTSEREVVVRLDRTPPLLGVEAPVDGSLTTATALLVRGDASDGGATVQVTIGGVEVPLGPAGRFERLVALEEGDQRVEFVARDEAGLEARITRLVRVDRTAPGLIVRAPKEGFTTTATSVVVSGRAIDEWPGSIVSLQGQPLPLRGDGVFETAVDLPLGATRIDVEARDQAGNTTRASRSVVRTAPPPVIVIVSPPPPALPTPPPAPAQPSPPTEIVSATDGSVALWVPSGTALVGEPPRAVAVAALYVDRAEVSVAQYERFLSSPGYGSALSSALKAHGAPAWLDRARAARSNFVFAASGDEVEVASIDDLLQVFAQGPYFWTQAGRRPPSWNGGAPSATAVAGVSWFEAIAYANWAGRRLPTEAEWVRARDVLDARLAGIADEPAEWCADEPTGGAEAGGRVLRIGRDGPGAREVVEPTRRAMTGLRCVVDMGQVGKLK